jgi:hypothetical protein
MPWIFRYFWFIAAAFMLANVVIVRRRLEPLVARGLADRREVGRFVLWLTAWFVIGPLIFGTIGFLAGWSSPFCGGIMQFGTGPQLFLSVANLVIWASVLWWIWRGGGDDFLSRVGPALGNRPSSDRRYSPQLVRVAGTALILVSALGGIISWRVMPPSPELTCPSIGSASRAP